MARAMTKTEAWLYAAQWGSYVRNGDPGACMYGFNESFKVQSEEHRQACLGQVEKAVEKVKAFPTHYERNELRELGRLKDALIAADSYGHIVPDSYI